MFDSSEEIEFVIQCLSRSDAKRRSSGNVYIKCPFHDEKTASFVYRPKTRRWYCYGCHAHGEIPEELLAYNGPLEGQLRFSFEGKAMSDTVIKLGIGIPAYGAKISMWAAEMFLSLGSTLAASEQRFSLRMLNFMDVCGIDVARNKLTEEALNQQCDWLLMVDADTFHPDGFDILRMISEADRIPNTAAVAAPVPRRAPNDTHLMIYNEVGGERVPVDRAAMPSELFPIRSAATALMAINLKFLREKKIPAPWFEFTWIQGTTKFLSEDLFFANKMNAAGGTILADGRFVAKHLQRPEILE